MKKITILFFGLCILLTSTLSAENKKTDSKDKKPVSFGIYPPVIDLSCTPGQKMNTSIRIENTSDQVGHFSIEMRGIVVGEGGGFSYKPVASLPADDLARHLKLESPEIEIPAKTSKNVSLFMDVPSTLKGTQYVGLTVVNLLGGKKEEASENRSEEYKSKLGVGMQAALGVTIKCHMQGTEAYAYEIKSIEVKAAQGNQPTRATVEIKNTGNSELKMLPSLILLDSAHKVVGRLKGADQVSLLPGSVTKVYLQSLFKDIPAGEYKAIFSSAISDSKIAPAEKNVVVK